MTHEERIIEALRGFIFLRRREPTAEARELWRLAWRCVRETGYAYGSVPWPGGRA